MFTQKSQYGLTLMVTRDPALTDYLNTILEQMSGTFDVVLRFLKYALLVMLPMCSLFA